MLRFRDFFAVLLLMVATVAIGCEGGDNLGDAPTTGDGTNDDGTTTPEKNSEVLFDRNELNVDGNGGDMDIIYRIKNAVEGATLEVVSRADWVSVKGVSDRQILLSIEKNRDNEAREGLVTVDYAGLERSVFITVRQDKAILDMFSFEVTDITYNSCTVRYISTDENLWYMANVIDKQFFEYSGVDTEEAFVETEMKNYLRIASDYNMTLEELMKNATPQLIYRGEAVRKFSGMQHSGQYVIYCYGVNFDGNSYELTTPIHHTIVELPMPSMYDVTFNLQTKTSEGGAVTLTVDPCKWSGYYSIQIAPGNSLQYTPEGEPLSQLTIQALANAFFNNARTSMAQGNSPDMFLSSSCYKGFGQYPLALERGNRYMIIVFAVESENGAIPVMRSVPTVTYVYL